MTKSVLKAFLDLIFPPLCLGCGKRLKENRVKELIACAGCLKGVKKNLAPFCLYCGRKIDKNSFAKNICPRCQRKTVFFDRAFSPCAYEGLVKKIISDFKYKGKDYLGKSLGNLLTDFIREYRLPIEMLDYIIALPLHPVKLREREFNQAEILARIVADEFNRPFLPGALKKIKPTPSQTELEEKERFNNVAGTFALGTKSEHIHGKNILLVDDVLTTGATASEAARVLKDSGAGIVFVLTVAN